MTTTPFQAVSDQIDAANKQDPNLEEYLSVSHPKELLYSNRMVERLLDFYPKASEEVIIAAKAQHICRWKMPRESYPMDRAGYLKWREDLKKFHAKTTASILKECGYSDEFSKRVSFLIEKQSLKKDTETQLLEDVICLVFLEFYFNAFVKRHDETKLKNIILRTWHKMSDKGREEALKINFSSDNLALIKDALGL